MDLALESVTGNEHLAYETGGWLTCRLPRPDWAHKDAEELLAMSLEPRRGNLRCVLAGGLPILVGELRAEDGYPPLDEARERFAKLPAKDAEVAGAPSEIDVECCLAETGLAWTRKDGEHAWRALANGPRAMRCDLKAEIQGNGVEVSAELAAYEEPLEGSARCALAWFLVTASSRLRFVRLLLGDHAVRAASFAASDRLEIELHDSVAAVVSAYGLLWRETRALLRAGVARAFLAARESSRDAGS